MISKQWIRLSNINVIQIIVRRTIEYKLRIHKLLNIIKSNLIFSIFVQFLILRFTAVKNKLFIFKIKDKFYLNTVIKN